MQKQCDHDRSSLGQVEREPAGDMVASAIPGLARLPIRAAETACCESINVATPPFSAGFALPNNASIALAQQ